MSHKTDHLSRTGWILADTPTQQRTGKKYKEEPFVIKAERDTDTVADKGEPITPAAASEMIKTYSTVVAENFNKIPKNEGEQITKEDIETYAKRTYIATVFGKNTLLRLLSQKDCEGIIFHSCINDEGNASLVLCPVNKRNKPMLDLLSESTIQKNGGDNIEIAEKGGTRMKASTTENNNPASLFEYLNNEGNNFLKTFFSGTNFDLDTFLSK